MKRDQEAIETSALLVGVLIFALIVTFIGNAKGMENELGKLTKRSTGVGNQQKTKALAKQKSAGCKVQFRFRCVKKVNTLIYLFILNTATNCGTCDTNK